MEVFENDQEYSHHHFQDNDGCPQAEFEELRNGD